MARNTYEVDENLDAKLDFEKLKRISKYVKPYTKSILFVLLLVSVSSIAGMFIPLIMEQAIDVEIPNKNIDAIHNLAIYILIISLFISIVLRARSRIMARIGQKIVYEIREDLFTHIQNLPFSYFDSRPHGKIQVRVVSYVNNLSDILSGGIINLITDLFSLFYIIGFMLYVNVQFTIISLIGLPVLIGVISFIQAKQRKAWQSASNKQSNLNAYIAESINGIKITQSFVREGENSEIFNRLSNSYRETWLRAVKYNFLLPPMVDNISVFLTAFIYVYGVYALMGGDGVITAGAIYAFSNYIGRFWAPINNMTTFYNNLLTSLSYVERIFETMDEELEIEDKEGAVEMPPIKGDIEFKDVYFSYEDDVDILKGVNISIKAGESIAIVGPTGSGKTTIVNLLSRFYNIKSGKLSIDGIDVESVTIKSLRNQVGVMMQDSFIFSGTIEDNIRYGNKEATREQIINAAKIVCADEFIMNMENGYDTVVKERGGSLSVGQKQLISFARALLADPKILILDEATSSIDTKTEKNLQEGLAKLLVARTSLIIAHRLSTIKNCDCILYVKDGIIEERGNHDALIKQEGQYYNLYSSQYKFLEE